MNKMYYVHRWLARLPIRWRLALVSFGLLALLLTLLGIFISTVEEKALLDSQASVLNNDARMMHDQLQVTKFPLTTPLILSFSTMSSDMAASYITGMRSAADQNISVSLLSFDGEVLATDSQNPESSVFHTRVQHELISMASSYLLVNDSQGQRRLVVLEPIAGWDKSAASLSRESLMMPTTESLAGYRKAVLQLSISTASIDQSMAITRLILALGILGALSIAAALTLPLINIALRPLVEMERVSTSIAAGALSLRLDEPPANDEIGHMARAFNSMIAQLEGTFARQKRFVADVSHELRTPLTGLGGSLEMLLLRADDGDEQTARRLMVGMYNEVERMQRLVADLLALARLDEGRSNLRISVVDVHELVSAVCEQIQGLVHDQKLCCSIASNLPAIHGDSDQLRRILLNIVENALKFTPPTGRIELSAYSDHVGSVTIKVSDTGIGIPQEALPHVFDRFYRADPSRTRPGLQRGGSGLGLSIAKELVEAHNGSIAINSVVGQGTTVLISLHV